MTFSKYIMLILVLLGLFIAAPIAHAETLSGGTGGGPGSFDPGKPTGAGALAGADTFDLYMNRSGFQPTRLAENAISACNLGKTITTKKNGKTVSTKIIPNVGGSAETNWKLCAAKLAGIAGGAGTTIKNSPISNYIDLNNLCSPTLANRASKLDYCLNNPANKGIYSSNEIHTIGPHTGGQGPEYKDFNTAVSSYSIYVWRVNLKKPSAASKTPIFQRSVTAYQNANVTAGWTDLGKVKAASSKKCAGLAGITKCQDDAAYYKGGSSSGNYFYKGGATPNAGPLWGGVDEDTNGRKGCGDSWDTGFKALAKAKSPEDFLQNKPAGGFVRGKTSLAAYAGNASAPNSCFFKLKGGAAKYYYVTNNGEQGDSGVAVQESLAVAFGRRGGLDYTLQGLPGNLYVVSVYAISGREKIIHTDTRTITAPGLPGTYDDKFCVKASDCPGIQLPPGTGTGTGLPTTLMPDDDSNPFPGDINNGSTTVYQLPDLLMKLEAPDTVSAGETTQWQTTVENDSVAAYSDGAIMWLREIGFKIADPQVKQAGWGQTVNNQRFYVDGKETDGAFYVGRPNGNRIHSRNANALVPAYWGLDIDLHVMNTQSYIKQVNPFMLVDPVQEPFITNTLIPNQTEKDPQLGESYLVYEAGRFVDNDNGRANCQTVTRQMRSNRPGVVSEYPVLAQGSTIAQGFMFHQEPDVSAGSSVCPRSAYTVDMTFVGSSPSISRVRVSDTDSLGSSVDFYLTGSYVNANTYRVIIPASAGMVSGGYLISAELTNGSDTPFTMTVTGNMDRRDMVQWAGQTYGFGPFTLTLGSDNDPYYGGQAENSDCDAGECTIYSNIEEVHTLGNQPG